VRNEVLHNWCWEETTVKRAECARICRSSVFVVVGAALLVHGHAVATTYFVDSVNGSDSERGTRMAAAWKSLDKVNQTTFRPGDRILFRSGGAWSGQLHPKGSGVAGDPIIIDKYGTGPLPLIAGEGTVGLPGNATVYLYNQEYWEISNIEITNLLEGNTDVKRGVYVGAEDYGSVNHIHLSNLVVHDVNGTLETKHNGGIFLEVTGDSVKTWFDDVLIEGCHVHDVDRTGISNQSSWQRRSFDDNMNWVPNRNVVIRNNVVERSGQNGLIVRCCEGARIEYNVFKDNGAKGSGNAMFPFNSNNTLVQFNESYGTIFNPGEVDGGGFDSDWQCKNSLFQYNYSHDNDHGFMLVCCQGGPRNFNDGTVVRYNISQNDGGNAFRISGQTTNTRIYNNVIYLGPQMDTRVVWHKSWQGWPDGTSYFNNIFYNLGTGNYDFGSSTNNLFDYNVFFGNHPSREPDDPHKITASPQFVNPGRGATGMDTLDGYKLRPGSPAIDSGKNLEGLPESDFWGNPVPQNRVVDRGAYEYGNDVAEP